MSYRLASRVEIARGRSSEFDKTGTGTASVAVTDRLGFVDPTNEDSPFNIDPMRQSKVEIVNPWKLLYEDDDTAYSLFRGYVTKWGPFEVEQAGRVITGEIQMADALELFANLRMMPGHGDTSPKGAESEVYFAGGPNGWSSGSFVHVDDRIVQILDMIGWEPIGEKRMGKRDVFSGNVRELEQVYARADDALAAIDDAVDSEFPFVAQRFMTKDGVFAFRGRFARFNPFNPDYGINHWFLGGRPQAEADPENVVVISHLPAFWVDAEDLINSALVTPAGVTDEDVPGNLITDEASIDQYGYRSRNTPDLLTYQGHDDEGNRTTAVEETRKMARFRVGNYATPTTRIGQIVVTGKDPRHPLAQALWDFLTRVELNDVISLETTHPGGGGFNDDFFVEGLRYVIEVAPEPKWYHIECTLDVSPRSLYSYNPFGEVDTGLT